MRRIVLIAVASSLVWGLTPALAQQNDRTRRGPAGGRERVRDPGGNAEAIERSLRNYRIRLSDDGKVSGMVNLIDPNTSAVVVPAAKKHSDEPPFCMISSNGSKRCRRRA